MIVVGKLHIKSLTSLQKFVEFLNIPNIKISILLCVVIKENSYEKSVIFSSEYS